MKDLHEDNKQLKGRIHDMQNEKREQKKIKSQLKKEIAEIKTNLNQVIQEQFKLKPSLLQSKTVADRVGHLNDDYKRVKTIETNSSKPGIKQKAEAVNSLGRKSSKPLLIIKDY